MVGRAGQGVGLLELVADALLPFGSCIPHLNITLVLDVVRLLQEGTDLPSVEVLLSRMDNVARETLDLGRPYFLGLLAPAEALSQVVTRPERQYAEGDAPIVRSRR